MRSTHLQALLVLFAALLLLVGCDKKEGEAPAATNAATNAAAPDSAATNAGAAPDSAATNAAAPDSAATNAGAAIDSAATNGSAEAAQAPLVPQPGAQVGDRTICPSMMSEFVVKADSPSVEHEGQTVYFCCAGCGEKFAEGPAAALEAANAMVEEKNAGR